MIKITHLKDVALETPLLATDGGVVVSNYNETLDSATIRIPHLSDKLDIKPFDNVRLVYGNETKYMCIDSYTCTEENIDVGFKKYAYEIKLFSEVKKLERVLMPNLSITPRKIGTKFKISDYLKQYLDEYCPKHIVSGGITDYKKINKGFVFTATGEGSEYVLTITNDGYNHYQETITRIDCATGVETYEIEYVSETSTETSYVIRCTATGRVSGNVLITLSKTGYDTSKHLVNDYSLKSGYIDKFSDKAPEMQWNNPNLREVLNDLMMLQDCVLTMENGVIGWLDLTEKKNPITQYNYIQESQGSDDFETDLRMELKNVMQTQVDGVDNKVKTLERIMFKPNDFILTSDNITLKTQYPILRILKLTMHIFPVYSLPSTADANKVDYDDEYGYDITGFVKEANEYNTLSTLYRSGITITSVDSYPDDYFQTYQNFNVYFTRYSNEITGWTRQTKSSISDVFYSFSTLQWLKAIVYGHYIATKTAGTVLTNTHAIDQGENTYASVYFDIEYETTASCVFEAGKSNVKGFKSVIMDNQTNAWADAYSVGRLEYQKANRMGNKQYMVNQRITDTTNQIKIGDYLDDKIVYQVQYQSYIDHEEVNAYCVEGYILQNYFTGIQSKVRTWVNAKEEAFERHDLKKYYCEFSKTSKQEVLDNDIVGIGKYLLSPITQEGRQIKVIGIKTDATDNWYSVGCLTRIVGSSMIFTTGFNDNAFVDKYCDKATLDDITSDNTIVDGEITLLGQQMDAMHINWKMTNLRDYLGGIPYNQYGFVDENFECRQFEVRLGTDYYYFDLNAKGKFIEAMSFPKVVGNYIIVNSHGGFQLKYDLHKDNKEIPMISLQYEFCSDTQDIQVLPKWITYERAVATNTGNVSIVDDDGVVQSFTKTITENENYGLITINESITANKWYYFKVGNDKVLKFRNTQTIYLNIRRNRYE